MFCAEYFIISILSSTFIPDEIQNMDIPIAIYELFFELKEKTWRLTSIIVRISLFTLFAQKLVCAYIVDKTLGWVCDMGWKDCVLTKLQYVVRFEVFTAMTMKNAICCDVKPCGSCKDRNFGGTYPLHHQGDKNRWARNKLAGTNNRRTLQRTIAVPSSPILVTLMMEAKISSEKLVLIWARRNIPEDGIIHSHRRETLKSCIALTGRAL
jgi:hypothetical protein